jgi:EF hand
MRRPARYLPLVLISSLAFAASAPPKAHNKPQAKPASEDKNPYVERFKQLDRNHDGYVTLDEWPLDEASFRIVDRNGDGRLSPGELLQPSILRDQPAPFQLPLLEPHPPGPRVRSPRIPLYENLWSSRATPQDQVRFQLLDRNHDGRLSRAEWMGPSITFDRLDINRDGVITPNEWPRR